MIVAVAPKTGLPWQDSLKAGDVIYTVNGESVLDIAALRAALDKAREKGSAVVQVEREGGLRYVAVPLD